LGGLLFFLGDDPVGIDLGLENDEAEEDQGDGGKTAKEFGR